MDDINESLLNEQGPYEKYLSKTDQNMPKLSQKKNALNASLPS